MIDIIITEFLPLCFKMAESFENLDNILCGWAKHKVQKSLARHCSGSKSMEEERTK